MITGAGIFGKKAEVKHLLEGKHNLIIFMRYSMRTMLLHTTQVLLDEIFLLINQMRNSWRCCRDLFPENLQHPLDMGIWEYGTAVRHVYMLGGYIFKGTMWQISSENQILALFILFTYTVWK